MASSSSKSRGNVRTAKPRTPSGAIGGLLGALAMSAIAGVLVTVAVTPVVAVGGTAAGTAIDIFNELPTHLDPGQLAQPSTIYGTTADGTPVELATFFAQNRVMVPLSEISQYAIDAAVATEDPRFFSHGGVDVWGLGRAVLGEVSGQDAGGASTITMQWVRNVLVQRAEAILDEDEREAAYEDAMRQDYDRKLQEIRYAVSVEKRYSKNEILVGYMNITNFGDRNYGIEAASQSYYGKSAKDLTLPEAASIVGIVQFPSDLNLSDPENIEANQERRDYVLQRMLDAGRITQAQHDEAVATDVVPNPTQRQTGCVVAEANYGLGHFCDYVQRYVELDPSFGNTAEERHFNFLRGGYKIYSTINFDMQAGAVAGVRENVPPLLDNMSIGAAVVSVQVGTGRVLAMAQNRPFNADPDWLAAYPEYTSVNYNTDFEYGGSSGFQVGSTSKAFTLAEWLRAGNSLNDSVLGNARTVSNTTFRAGCLGGIYGGDSWTFRNDAGEMPGNISVLSGTQQSLNGVFVSMQQRLDLCETIDLAERLGVHRASDQYVDPDTGAIANPTLNSDLRGLSVVPSMAFAGTDEIAPISMATAYAAFANAGTTCTPVPIDTILDSEGQEVSFTKSKCTEAISPDVAAGVTYALESVVTGGTGSHARSPYGVPHFLKTGTTDDAADRWNVGGSSTVATAVWTGNVIGKVSLNNSGLGRPERAIFNSVMNAADAFYGGEAFPDPPRSATQRVMVAVPSVQGLTYAEAEGLLTAAGFGVMNGGEVDSSIAAGLVAASDPVGEAGRGSNITLFVSRGNLKAIPDGLVGSTAGSARSSLASAGFSNVETRCTAPGRQQPGNNSVVESVNPPSGTEANPSGQIILSVKCS